MATDIRVPRIDTSPSDEKPRRQQRRRNLGGAAGAVAAVAAVTAIGVGLANVGGAPEDGRTRENRRNEVALLTNFLGSGKTETHLGDATVTSYTGTVFITQSSQPNKVPVPINLRYTPDFQRRTDNLVSDDNTAFSIGYTLDDDKERSEANVVRFDNPLVVTYAGGDSYVGSVVVASGQKYPHLDSAEEVADRMVWANVSRIQEGGVYSGAAVTFVPAEGAGGEGTEMITLDHGRLVGTANHQSYGEATYYQNQK